MATAIRPRIAVVTEEDPGGDVPTPFPNLNAFLVPPNSEVTDQVSGKDTELILPVDALQSIRVLEHSVTRALNVLLEPYFPHRGADSQTNAAKSEYSSRDAFSADVAVTLHTILDNMDVQMPVSTVAIGSVTHTAVKISDRLSALEAGGLLNAPDSLLLSSLLSVLSSASVLTDTALHIAPRKLTEFKENSLEALRDSLADVLEFSDVDVDRPGHSSPITAVQRSLAWRNIQDTGSNIIDVLEHRHQTNDHPHLHSGSRTTGRDSFERPPEYEYEPPAYETQSNEKLSSSQVRHVQSAPDLQSIFVSSSSSTVAEKMRVELDDVTKAVERIWAVSPQLKDQRVELKAAKRDEMDLARILGSVQRLGNRLEQQRAASGMRSTVTSPKTIVDKGKGRATDPEDLEDFLELLGKAQRTRLAGQRAVVSDDVIVRLKRIEAIKTREASSREAFVERITHSVEGGRLKSQDAVFTRPPIREKHNLLTLPEFIHESSSTRPDTSSSSGGNSFDTTHKTSPSLSRKNSSTSTAGRALKSKRSFLMSRPRSQSAPSRAFLTRSKSQPDAFTQTVAIQYVAEHQENLRVVSVQVTLPPTSIPQKHWAVSFFEHADASFRNSSRLELRLDNATALIELPVPLSTLQKDSIASNLLGNRVDIKISTTSSSLASNGPPPLMDAVYLTTASPSMLICSSCSLPFVQCSSGTSQHPLLYSDLPSEYWSEMVEAWMCHTDQKFSDNALKNGRDGSRSQPTTERILVGGSYILVDENLVRIGNLKVSESNKHNSEWHQIRCICGAVVGARQFRGGTPSSSFRLSKYALRLVGSNAEFERLPLSAFIVADMMELVRAHASYRFVIRDEEDEKIRMLIWLFNPTVHISHSLVKAYVLPRSGTSQAAKVLFKLIGPSENIPIEELGAIHPDFASAEHLFYPLSVCHSVAMLLRESNSAYPESSRLMGHLSMAWLRTL